MSENKFVMGEDDESKGIPENLSPPLTTTPTPTQHKKPMRHHVKRRSSGRVHVAKLAPMTRSNSTNFIDTELNEDTESRPAMRRSQSNRSLHKMSLDRRGFTAMTPRRKSTASSEKLAAFQVVSSLPTPSTSTTSTNNPASLSSSAIAQPIEQTFNAVANNLVVPKTSDLFDQQQPKKQPLRSQFVSDMSRTQQKLNLQKQQALSEDENSPSHPRNQSKLNKEFDMISREYRCIRKYQDPMLSSLIRCVEKLDIEKNPHITRLQPASNIPHLEQRQIAHRHHHLKAVALSNKQPSQSSVNSQDSTSFWPWNATTLIDRLFSGNS